MVIFLMLPGRLLAAERFITVINPVRGYDFWPLPSQKPEDFVLYQKEALASGKIKATWLLRPDFIFNNDLAVILNRDVFNDDEKGIFLEITPLWASKAGVEYNTGDSWSSARNVFLSGYNRGERKKLIDAAFATFKDFFGHYPQTVGAWHIDAYSAEYMQKQYGTEAILICSDQLTTDRYQIWGGWWGVPYYPDKTNLLAPASNLKSKLNLIILWWAQREPFKAYDTGSKSRFSVQVNDYLGLNLSTNYFSDLVDYYLFPKKGEFGQITFGLENDYEIDKYGSEYENGIKTLQLKGAQFVTSRDFVKWYKETFRETSPEHEIGDEKAFWLMDKERRVGLIKQGEDWIIRDLRYYLPVVPDPYLWQRNLTDNLYWNIPSVIDSTKGIEMPKKTEVEIPELKDKHLPFSNNQKWIFWTVLLALILLLIFKPPFCFAVFITVASLLFSMTMLRSGRLYDFGMGFWGPNGHDGIWHISLIEQLSNGLLPKNPVYSGEVLTGYHWGFDLLAAVVSKITFLSAIDIYFRLLPILLAFLIGILGFKLAFLVTKRKSIAFWFVFLNYFAGSFGWMVTLARNRTIGGESLFWSMQSVSSLINPPFALSIALTFLAMIIWLKKRVDRKLIWAILAGILFGLLMGVKVYAGILTIASLFSLWGFNKLYHKEKASFDFVVCLTAGITSVLVLGIMGVFSGGVSLVFKPFWFIHSMIESLDKLYLPKVAILRFNLSHQLLSFKLIVFLLLESALVCLFLAGNLGTRIFGFLAVVKKFTEKQIEEFDKFSLLLFFYSFFLPLFFVQKGTTWNTIQFFYYFLLFANFYLATFIVNFWKKRTFFSLLFIITLIIFTVPTTFSTLKDYFGFPPPSAISYPELFGLDFLRKQPAGAILTFPFDKYKKDNLATPIPLYLYETTAYVSALTGKQTYLGDEMNLEITGYHWEERLKQVRKFFTAGNKDLARKFLLDNDIKYLYLVNDQKFFLQEGDLGIKMIFDNGQVKIYEVLE